MTDLRAAFEAAGCTDVRSYIQSGNVIFDASDGSILPRVVDEVTTLIGGPANILFRTVEDLESLVEEHPFGSQVDDRKLKLYVVFLAGAPATSFTLPIVSEKEVLEVIAVTGREAYVVSRRKPGGMYGFPNAVVEKELGVAATSRNWSTVTKLLAFARQGTL